MAERLREKVYSLKWWLLLLSAVILLLLRLILPWAQTGTAAVIVDELITVVLASVVIGLVFEKALRDEMIRLVLEKVKLKEGVAKIGIVDAYLRAGEEIARVEFANLISCANESICFLAQSGGATFRAFQGAFLGLLDKGCAVRVLISDQSNPFIEEWERLEPREAGEITKEIELALGVFRAVIREAERTQARGTFDLRSYDVPVFCNMMIVDQKYIWYTPYLVPKGAKDHPAFLLSTDPREGGNPEAVQQYIDHFERVWAMAKQLMQYPG